MRKLLLILSLITLSLLAACAHRGHGVDPYTEFRQVQPKSILVLMPTNSSPEAQADLALLALATQPIAERGYYVFPVAMVNELFQENGLTNGHDIQSVGFQKLRDVFGADAALYIDVTDYGSSYRVFSSVTTVSVDVKLVDLRTGQVFWQDHRTATSNDNSNSLLATLIFHIINSLADKGYQIANNVSWYYANSFLPGPRLNVNQQ